MTNKKSDGFVCGCAAAGVNQTGTGDVKYKMESETINDGHTGLPNKTKPRIKDKAVAEWINLIKLLDKIDDGLPIPDEIDKKKKETKPADKGAETYSKLCKRYRKVPINSVMKQFGKEVISLDGFDLSSRELKAFFVALLVSCFAYLLFFMCFFLIILYIYYNDQN